MQYKGGNLWTVLFHFILNMYVYISNDTKSHKKLHFTFVPTELLIDGPEEYNQLGSAFISIYRRYAKAFY